MVEGCSCAEIKLSRIVFLKITGMSQGQSCPLLPGDDHMKFHQSRALGV